MKTSKKLCFAAITFDFLMCNHYPNDDSSLTSQCAWYLSGAGANLILNPNLPELSSGETGVPSGLTAAKAP